MGGYESNEVCIRAYLELFRSLSADEVDAERCRTLWAEIEGREADTEELLGPSFLRRRLELNLRDFLLTMAALALELDVELRDQFNRRSMLSLPTLEYGLSLIAPLCPVTYEDYSEMTEYNTLQTLILMVSENNRYQMESPLVLNRGAFAFLTGFGNAEIPGCRFLVEGDRDWLPLHEKELEQVRNWHLWGAAHPLYLCGPEGSGRRSLLCRGCEAVVSGDLTQLRGMGYLDQHHQLREMVLHTALLGAVLCIKPDEDGFLKEQTEQLCRRAGIPLAILVEEDRKLTGAWEVVRLPAQLRAEERAMVWRAALPEADPDAQPDGSMTVGAVQETAALSRRFALEQGREKVSRRDMRRAMLQRGGALEFGIRYDCDISMEEMVLAPEVKHQLERICQAAQYGAHLGDWGLPRTREGVTAVFHGPSGTGKTMAASMIAARLGMPLLRTDLSQIMDKYVGETEKHLGRLLQCARKNHCVLLFDEADALFGKRSNVSTAHDKYANLSTSYLLQEIEQYDGVALLSTNLLSNFDDAFLRRLNYIVRFSLPTPELREELWRRAVPEHRREGNIPFGMLAQVELSPARIYAAARNGAVGAIAAGRDRMNAGEVIAALRMELEKGGKPLPRELSNYQEK